MQRKRDAPRGFVSRTAAYNADGVSQQVPAGFMGAHLQRWLLTIDTTSAARLRLSVAVGDTRSETGGRSAVRHAQARLHLTPVEGASPPHQGPNALGLAAGASGGWLHRPSGAHRHIHCGVVGLEGTLAAFARGGGNE